MLDATECLAHLATRHLHYGQEVVKYLHVGGRVSYFPGPCQAAWFRFLAHRLNHLLPARMKDLWMKAKGALLPTSLLPEGLLAYQTNSLYLASTNTVHGSLAKRQIAARNLLPPTRAILNHGRVELVALSTCS
jgi:hypothetical protein